MKKHYLILILIFFTTMLQAKTQGLLGTNHLNVGLGYISFDNGSLSKNIGIVGTVSLKATKSIDLIVSVGHGVFPAKDSLILASAMGVSGLYNFRPNKNINPYLSIGIGIMTTLAKNNQGELFGDYRLLGINYSIGTQFIIRDAFVLTPSFSLDELGILDIGLKLDVPLEKYTKNKAKLMTLSLVKIGNNILCKVGVSMKFSQQEKYLNF